MSLYLLCLCVLPPWLAPAMSDNDPGFTGPGSYYDLSQSTEYLLGLRVRTRRNGAHESGLDYIKAFTSRARWNELAATHPLRRRAPVRWLLIGDGTERDVLNSWCQQLMKIAETGTSVNLTKVGARPRTYHYQVCSITADGKARLKMANFYTFGAYNASTQNRESTKHATTMRWRSSENLDGPDRIRDTASDYAQQTLGGAPHYVSLGSCLWDMNLRYGVEYGQYRGFYPDQYAQGLRAELRAARAAFPNATLLATTCKPVSRLDVPPTNATTTRTHRLQVALDDALKLLVSREPSLADGLVDSTSILGGFEYFASSQNGHYTGAGAVTFANTLLNEFVRVDSAREEHPKLKCSLLVIASISAYTDMRLVEKNIAQFDTQRWKCLILGYSNRTDYPSSPCDVVINPNTFWGEILHLNSARMNDYDCDTYMLLLDDVDILNLNVSKLSRFAQTKDTDIVSPEVRHASYPWMEPSGKETDIPFIEIYATIFNQRAWNYFHVLLQYLPGIGWGYDVCLGKYFSKAIDRTQTVSHMDHRSIGKYATIASHEESRLEKWCGAHPPPQARKK